MTVFFLLMACGSLHIDLAAWQLRNRLETTPLADVPGTPLDPGPVLFVTPDAVEVDASRVLASLPRRSTVDWLQDRGLSPGAWPLEALDSVHSAPRDLQAPDLAGDLLLAMDPEVPWRQTIQVLLASGQAGFSTFDLLVRHESRLGVLPLETPRYCGALEELLGTGGEEGPCTRPVLVVTASGFRLMASEGRVGPSDGCAVSLGMDLAETLPSHEIPALTKALHHLVEGSPGCTVGLFGAEADVPWRDSAPGLAALLALTPTVFGFVPPS